MHGIGDGGPLQLWEEWRGEELVLVGVGIGEGNSQASGSPLSLGLPKTLFLGPAILEPDFDLCLCKFQVLCELCPFSYREVFLLAKFPLQCDELCACERSSRLPVFLLLFQFCWSNIAPLTVVATVTCSEQGRKQMHSQYQQTSIG